MINTNKIIEDTDGNFTAVLTYTIPGKISHDERRAVSDTFNDKKLAEKWIISTTDELNKKHRSKVFTTKSSNLIGSHIEKMSDDKFYVAINYLEDGNPIEIVECAGYTYKEGSKLLINLEKQYEKIIYTNTELYDEKIRLKKEYEEIMEEHAGNYKWRDVIESENID